MYNVLYFSFDSIYNTMKSYIIIKVLLWWELCPNVLIKVAFFILLKRAGNLKGIS